MERVNHSVVAHKCISKRFRWTACLAVSCAAFALPGCNSAGNSDGKRAPHSSSATNASGTQPAAPDAAHPLVVAGHAIISRESVGPLQLGTWRRPEMSFVYAIGATAGPHGEDMIAVRGIGKDTLTLMFVEDTLRRIDVRRPGPHTLDGIGIGARLDSLASERGAHSTVAAGVRTVTLDRLCGIAFRSDSARGMLTSAAQRVHSIIVGPCVTKQTP